MENAIKEEEKEEEEEDVTQMTIIFDNIQSSFYENTSGISAMKVEIQNLYKHFLLFECRRQMNSLEILQALGHLIVKYTGVYPP